MIQALFAALFWGATDALAGISSRRANPFLAALWLHIASLLLLAPVLAVSGMWRSLRGTTPLSEWVRELPQQSVMYFSGTA